MNQLNSITTQLPIPDIIHLYVDEHLAFKYIAKRYHVQPYVIRELLHKNNIQTRWFSHRATIDAKELEKLYITEHLTSKEIAKRLGLTFPTILHALHEYNIPVRDSHNEFTKNAITKDTLPSTLIDIKVVNGKRMGIAKCPVCDETRTISLHGKNDKDFTGVCRHCGTRKIINTADIELIKHLYVDDKKTAKQIAHQFNVSDMTIRYILSKEQIPIRKKGELHQRVIRNNGTLTAPVLGDIRRGTDIGLRDRFYYIWAECPTCHQQRWQGLSHFTRGRSPLCRVCSMELFGLNHTGVNAVNWLGGKSFERYTIDFNNRLKEQIRQRDNYVCQICGRPQKENEKALAIHHIDYNKKNTDPSNLISLCSEQIGKKSCHIRTNSRRNYWQAYFHSLLIARGIIEPDPRQPKRINKLQLALA